MDCGQSVVTITVGPFAYCDTNIKDHVKKIQIHCTMVQFECMPWWHLAQRRIHYASSLCQGIAVTASYSVDGYGSYIGYNSSVHGW